MENTTQSCHFVYKDVLNFSRRTIPWHGKWYKHILIAIPIIGPMSKSILENIRKSKNVSKTTVTTIADEVLNLQAGELVEVRSMEEISATLDENKKFRGLLFMPEMKPFCGKKFRIFKKVEKIMLESTGELRKLRSPTVFLEGVHCDGKLHEGCDRSCFLFWREAWLKRVCTG